MNFKKSDIEIVERIIQMGLVGFIEGYLKDRYIPVYVYIRWAEVAKDCGHFEIIELLHKNQTQTVLNKRNQIPKRRIH